MITTTKQIIEEVSKVNFCEETIQISNGVEKYVIKII